MAENREGLKNPPLQTAMMQNLASGFDWEFCS